MSLSKNIYFPTLDSNVPSVGYAIITNDLATYQETALPVVSGSGFPSNANEYCILGEHDGLSLRESLDDSSYPFPSGTFGVAAVPIDQKLYSNSINSATLYLRAYSVSTHSSNVNTLFAVSNNDRYNFQISSIIQDVDTSASGHITGMLTPGLNNVDITSSVLDVVNTSSWTTGSLLTFAIVPSTGNTGLLVVDTESSYVRFNYDPVPPTRPLNLVGDPGYKLIDLIWNTPVDDGEADIIEYVIEYAIRESLTDSALSAWKSAGISSSTSFRVENLDNDTLYVFRVAARNSAGLSEYSINSQPIQPSKAAAPRASNTFNDANYTRIRLRRDTAVNWSGTNPILGLGEPGFETDTNLLKIGNNSSGWNDLNYVKVDNDSIVFPSDRDVHLVVGDSKVNADSPRLSMNLSQSEKINIVAENGIDLQYNSS